MINPEDVLAYEFAPVPFEWNVDKVILYHLGLGAGASWLDPAELRYTFEEGLQVLPTFGVLASHEAITQLMRSEVMSELDLSSVVHGEHEIECHYPIPISGRAETHSRVGGIFDRPGGVLLTVECVTQTVGERKKLVTSRWSLFLRGLRVPDLSAGPTSRFIYPDRSPDIIVSSPVSTRTPQIYRLSGDKAALHISPEVARRSGFQTPILHGLCTFGMVCKAVIDSVAGGDATALRAMRGRFAKPGVPGVPIDIEIWNEPPGVSVRAKASDTGEVIFSNAVLSLRR